MTLGPSQDRQVQSSLNNNNIVHPYIFHIKTHNQRKRRKKNLPSHASACLDWLDELSKWAGDLEGEPPALFGAQQVRLGGLLANELKLNHILLIIYIF